MNRGRRKKQEVVLSSEEGTQLEAIASSRSMPHGFAQRARIVLLSAEGESDYAIADRLRVSRPTVAKWRRRYAELGLEGLYDELRPGRPRSIEDDQVAEVVRRTLETKPSHTTHWTVRSMADECAYGGRSASSPIGRGTSSFPTIRSSLRRSGTSAVST